MTRENRQTIHPRHDHDVSGWLWLSAVCLVGLLATGCATNRKSQPVPEQPAPISELRAPAAEPRNEPARAAAIAAAELAVAPAPTPTVKLFWNKNDWSPETVTEIWTTTNLLASWWLLTSVSGEQVTLPRSYPQQFFKIRNRLGNQVSDWSRNTP